MLRPLSPRAAGGCIRHAMDKFDFTKQDRGLQADTLDDNSPEPSAWPLEESIAEPEVAAAITSLFDRTQAAANSLECATTDLLQCGCDRRTLVLVPKQGPQQSP